jgi:hypothetical protein
VDDPDPDNETLPIPGRKFALDVAWPALFVGVEIRGGVANRGKHGRLAGYETDCEKNNLAILHGWKILAFTPQMIERDPARCVDIVLQAVKPEPLWADFLALKWKPITKCYAGIVPVGSLYTSINHMVLSVAKNRAPAGYKFRVDLVKCPNGDYKIFGGAYKRVFYPNCIITLAVSIGIEITPKSWRTIIVDMNQRLLGRRG